MDAGTVQVFVAVLGVLATLAGIIKILLNVNYKQQKELIKTKADLYIARSDELKAITTDHAKSIGANNVKQDETIKQLQVTNAMLRETKEQLNKYIEVNEKKMAAMNTVIQKLSKDVIFVTSKPKGQV